MLHDRPDVSPISADAPRGLSRRTLLGAGAAIGGGLLLGIELIGGHSAEAKDTEGGARFNAFVRVARDGAVTLIMPAVEMGQGAYTMQATLIAEELDVRSGAGEVAHAPPDQTDYGNPVLVAQVTGGSTSTIAWYLPLRKAGATARAMLVGAAAADWRPIRRVSARKAASS